MGKSKPVKLKVKKPEAQEPQTTRTVEEEIHSRVEQLHRMITTILRESLSPLREKLDIEEQEDGTKLLKIEGAEAQDVAAILIASPVEALIACLYDFVKPTAITETNEVPLFFYVKDRVDKMLEDAAMASLFEFKKYNKERAEQLFALFATRGITPKE